MAFQELWFLLSVSAWLCKIGNLSMVFLLLQDCCNRLMHLVDPVGDLCMIEYSAYLLTTASWGYALFLAV